MGTFLVSLLAVLFWLALNKRVSYRWIVRMSFTILVLLALVAFSIYVTVFDRWPAVFAALGRL